MFPAGHTIIIITETDCEYLYFEESSITFIVAWDKPKRITLKNIRDLRKFDLIVVNVFY